MSDLISRQAAIDALHMHLMYRMGTDCNKKRLDEWINNLPSAQPEYTEQDMREQFNAGYACGMHAAQPEQRWIPVTEALPKNGHYYLKCTKYGNVDVDYYWDGFENATKYGEEIVAWMEKPKPYKEGQDG